MSVVDFGDGSNQMRKKSPQRLIDRSPNSVVMYNSYNSVGRVEWSHKRKDLTDRPSKTPAF